MSRVFIVLFVMHAVCLHNTWSLVSSSTGSQEKATLHDQDDKKLPPDLARLNELLNHRDKPNEQSQAALLLIQSDSADAMTIVEQGMRRWDRPDIMLALLGAMRLQRADRHVPMLVAALACEQANVRQAVLDALSWHDKGVVSQHLSRLANDINAPLVTRQAAISAMGRSIHKAAVESLINLLTNDLLTIRQAAGLALQDLTGQSFGTDAARWQQWWQPYQSLSEEAWLISRAMYFADRAQRLQDELNRAENAILQLHQTLYGKIPTTDRVQHLRLMAQSDYPSVRNLSINWIAELLPEASSTDRTILAELMLQLSKDGVDGVQRQAVLNLDKVDDPRALERLLELLANARPSIRAAAARCLGRFGASKATLSPDQRQRAMVALEKALQDPMLSVVASAAESLGSLSFPEAAPILANLLKHPDDAVRLAASNALENIASPSVINAIYDALDDSSYLVRFALVGALGKTAARSTLTEPQLAELMKQMQRLLVNDSDPGVRSRVATVMGDMGGTVDLPLLWQRVRSNEDNRVQVRAWSAMIEILSRSRNMALVQQWDQILTEQSEHGRRVELFKELKERWSKQEAMKGHLEALASGSVRALLADRKWLTAMPQAIDLARKARTEAERDERLRWVLVAGSQGLDDKKPQDVMKYLKEIEDLPINDKDLSSEFALLRRKAQQQSGEDK